MGRIETFSTDGAPQLHRASLFQERMANLFSVGLAVTPSAKTPLSTRMTAYCGRRLQCADLHFSPHTTSSAGVRLDSPRLLVSLHKEGSAFAAQDGRESWIEPGDLVLIDPSRPFRIETGEMRTHSVYLQPSSLRCLLPQIDSYTARPIRTCSGQKGAMFRAMVDELFQLAPSMTEETADRIADALPYVLATALSSLEEDEGIAPSRLKAFHKQRILRFVRDHIHNHQLDARMIADGVNLSLRYVYELFSDEPEALMKRIWTERLERCKQDMELASLKHRSIGEIAYSWGFSDVAHFSRAFRARFGCSPRDHRKQSSACG